MGGVLLLSAAGEVAGTVAAAQAAESKKSKAGNASGSDALAAKMTELEARSGGRLGVAVLDSGNGKLHGWRGDERFPM